MMEQKSNVESFGQLFARIQTRPSLRDFFNQLFPHGLMNKETIELCGNSSSGKTLLLTQFIAKCILPVTYNNETVGGLGVSVVFLNTDHHFMMEKLRDFMLNILIENRITTSNAELIDSIIKVAYGNLIIINFYQKLQLSVTLQTLDRILMNNTSIGLVAMDSIMSYYWENKQCGGEWSIERYVKNIIQDVQKHTILAKIPFIYTKHTGSSLVTNKDVSTCVSEPTLGRINYRLNLFRSVIDDNFTCTVESMENKLELNYNINSTGIVFTERKKRKIDDI